MGKAKKTTKKRGRPPGSSKKLIENNEEAIEDELFKLEKVSTTRKSPNTEDYDNELLQQLKNTRKAKEKAINDDYEIEEDEEEEADAYIEGYDIELPEEEEFEEELVNIPKKGRKKKKRNYYDDFGIESEFYESDYNIGDYEE
ncbi:MAG: hypothetical protein ACFFCM_04450 [Promethearchaeota archaeon]